MDWMSFINSVIRFSISILPGHLQHRNRCRVFKCKIARFFFPQLPSLSFMIIIAWELYHDLWIMLISLSSNMYCGGQDQLFLNPGEDRLEDSYWGDPLPRLCILHFGMRISSEDCLFRILERIFCWRSKTNGPTIIIRQACSPQI